MQVMQRNSFFLLPISREKKCAHVQLGFSKMPGPCDVLALLVWSWTRTLIYSTNLFRFLLKKREKL